MNKLCLLAAILACFLLSACSQTARQADSTPAVSAVRSEEESSEDMIGSDSSESDGTDFGYTEAESPAKADEATLPDAVPAEEFSIDAIPEFTDDPYIEVNENRPYFTQDDLTTEAFESYSELDSLGRCGTAYANLCRELMPTEERGEIGMIKPTGWHLAKYEWVDGKYLYNRCHLIGYQLAGENANEKNLITGTRYLNVTGMLPYENRTADYIESTGKHVLYRVTPIFVDDELLARGVLMEGWSVEDEGAGICFCVFVYNAQPGVIIDYSTGDNQADENYEIPAEENPPEEQEQETLPATADTDGQSPDAGASEPDTDEVSATSGDEVSEVDYVLNKRSMKFHYPDCSGVATMSEKNREDFVGTRDEAIAMGYSPCGTCKP